jgi:mannose-6-phosphate isomerase-like protein (cupin superfamily)
LTGVKMEEAAERTTTVQLGPVTVRYVHADAGTPYALIEWIAPPGAPSPPVHVHRRTDEGFYVLEGTFRFLLDGARIDAGAGAHVLVPKGQPHTFWNASRESARCLVILSPADYAPYFRELADALAASDSDDPAMTVRQELSARYDIDVVGPPVDVHGPAR